MGISLKTEKGLEMGKVIMERKKKIKKLITFFAWCTEKTKEFLQNKTDKSLFMERK